MGRKVSLSKRSAGGAARFWAAVEVGRTATRERTVKIENDDGRRMALLRGCQRIAPGI
jgi:hypothetical protein